MNNLMDFMSNMGMNQSPISGMTGYPRIRFRDILQLLLLSVAVRIVSRAYEIMARLGAIPTLPMQMPQQSQPMLLQFPPMPTPERKDT